MTKEINPLCMEGNRGGGRRESKQTDRDERINELINKNNQKEEKEEVNGYMNTFGRRYDSDQ